MRSKSTMAAAATATTAVLVATALGVASIDF